MTNEDEKLKDKIISDVHPMLSENFSRKLWIVFLSKMRPQVSIMTAL